MSRDRRERQTAAFVGARDGALAAQLGGREVFGPAGLPEYALGDQKPAVKDGEDLFREWGHLARSRTDN